MFQIIHQIAKRSAFIVLIASIIFLILSFAPEVRGEEPEWTGKIFLNGIELSTEKGETTEDLSGLSEDYVFIGESPAALELCVTSENIEYCIYQREDPEPEWVSVTVDPQKSAESEPYMFHADLEQEFTGWILLREQGEDSFIYSGKVICRSESTHQKESKLSITMPEPSYLERDKSTPLYDRSIQSAIHIEDHDAGIRKIHINLSDSQGNQIRYWEACAEMNAGEMNFSGDLETVCTDLRSEEGKIIFILLNLNLVDVGNDLCLTVETEDMAGSMDSAFYSFGIDESDPQIHLETNVSEGRTYGNLTYYKENRAFYISVNDENANFDTFEVLVSKDGSLSEENYETISCSDTEAEYALSLSKDGIYRITIRISDLSGHTSEIQSDLFVIDCTPPMISIEYQDEPKNGNYFAVERCLYISIREDHFDPAEFILFIKRDGQKREEQVRGDDLQWDRKIDSYETQYLFSEDGTYEIWLQATDIPGNLTKLTSDKSVSFFFVIDKEIKNNGSDMIIGFLNHTIYTQPFYFQISLADEHYESLEANLYFVDMKGKITDITDQNLYLTSQTDTGSTMYFSVGQNRYTDGIYLISAVGKDLAGNIKEEKLTAGLNVNGTLEQRTAFVQNLSELNNTYQKEITQDVMLTSYDLNSFSDIGSIFHVFRNGKETVSRETLSVTSLTEGYLPDWYRRQAVLPARSFEEEGYYCVKLYWNDIQVLENNISDLTVHFVVDRTAPSAELTIKEDAGDRYLVYRIFDRFGLETFSICSDGEVLLEGDISETDPYQKNGNLKLKGSEDSIMIYVTDKAGNISEKEISVNTGIVSESTIPKIWDTETEESRKIDDKFSTEMTAAENSNLSKNKISKILIFLSVIVLLLIVPSAYLIYRHILIVKSAKKQRDE